MINALLLVWIISFFACEMQTKLDGGYVIEKVVYQSENISLAHLFPLNALELKNGEVKKTPQIGKSHCGACIYQLNKDLMKIKCSYSCWLDGEYLFL